MIRSSILLCSSITAVLLSPPLRAQGLPDLAVDPSTMGSSLRLETRTFSSTSCAVQEGMVTTGTHRLLRFTTTYPNRGSADLHVGSPLGNPLFVYSPCHKHYHFKEYADYRLWTPAGYDEWTALRAANPDVLSRDLLATNPTVAAQMIEGVKRGFCVIDVRRDREATVRKHRQYTSCSWQGITRGWADEYSYRLEGQWIDVTGVAPGSYVLEVEVNAEHLFTEENYANNASAIDIVIP